MKKMLLLLALGLGLSFVANAQNTSTTEAVPIANGCGTENSLASRVGAAIATPIDVALTSPEVLLTAAAADLLTSPLLFPPAALLLDPKLFEKVYMQQVEKQIALCNEHDKAYFHGEPKQTADQNFKHEAPIKGEAVMLFEETSQAAYDSAQEERRKSEELQPTWEEENQACLDSQNYKIVEKDDGVNQTYISQEENGQTYLKQENTVDKETKRANRRNNIKKGIGAALYLLNELAR